MYESMKSEIYKSPVRGARSGIYPGFMSNVAVEHKLITLPEIKS